MKKLGSFILGSAVGALVSVFTGGLLVGLAVAEMHEDHDIDETVDDDEDCSRVGHMFVLRRHPGSTERDEQGCDKDECDEDLLPPDHEVDARMPSDMQEPYVI